MLLLLHVNARIRSRVSRFLLDTNIVSVHLRRPRGLVHRFIQHSGRLLIASAAITHDLTLVTNNIRHFEQIDGLHLED